MMAHDCGRMSKDLHMHDGLQNHTEQSGALAIPFAELNNPSSHQKALQKKNIEKPWVLSFDGIYFERSINAISFALMATAAVSASVSTTSDTSNTFCLKLATPALQVRCCSQAVNPLAQTDSRPSHSVLSTEGMMTIFART